MIKERIQYLGLYPHEKLPTLLNTFDVFVLPSISVAGQLERFGRVLIEAMSCGVPVVGSTAGEIPDTIGSGGLIFPEGDSQALRKCLLEIKQNYQLRQKLIINAQKEVQANYSWKIIAQKTFEIYQNVNQN